MKIQVHAPTSIGIQPGPSLRCPSCGENGTLEPAGIPNDGHNQQNAAFGARRCPKPECHALVFIIYSGGTVLHAYPPSRLDFDATNIPAMVAKAMEEAVACHAAECFIAAAIMVRKTLEELCRDRGATGPNLKERIKALEGRVIVPKELLEGADDLRLLGNDAAHIESQEFNQVGKDEVEVGIEFAKELLKAVYQYSTLLQRLRSLKKPSPLPPSP